MHEITLITTNLKKSLDPKWVNLILYIQDELKYGEVLIEVKDGIPVMITRTKQSIKL